MRLKGTFSNTGKESTLRMKRIPELHQQELIMNWHYLKHTSYFKSAWITEHWDIGIRKEQLECVLSLKCSIWNRSEWKWYSPRLWAYFYSLKRHHNYMTNTRINTRHCLCCDRYSKGCALICLEWSESWYCIKKKFVSINLSYLALFSYILKIILWNLILQSSLCPFSLKAFFLLSSTEMAYDTVYTCYLKNCRTNNQGRKYET